MTPREWVEKARVFLECMVDQGVREGDPDLMEKEALDLVNAKLDWRERQDDVPRELEVGRLLCEQEREALQELICAMFQTDPVSQTVDAPESYFSMAVRIRSKITGRSTKEIQAIAHGGTPDSVWCLRCESYHESTDDCLHPGKE